MTKEPCRAPGVGQESASGEIREMDPTAVGPSQKHPPGNRHRVHSVSQTMAGSAHRSSIQGTSLSWPIMNCGRDLARSAIKNLTYFGTALTNLQEPLLLSLKRSLPSLCRRAFDFCADDQNWVSLEDVVLVKRFIKRIYVEVWERAPPKPADNMAVLVGNTANPNLNNLTLGGTMSFECAAHATGAGFRAGDVMLGYQWQLGLPAVYSLPAGNEILVGGPALSIDADMLVGGPAVSTKSISRTIKLAS